MNISATDRLNGTYGIQAVSVTSQTKQAAPNFPIPVTEPPPGNYATWQAAYQSTFLK
jgi:hypothetical protein